jgi:hypothetical protein
MEGGDDVVGAVVGIFTSPLSDEDEKTCTPIDSNAVLSVYPPEQRLVGRMLSRRDSADAEGVQSCRSWICIAMSLSVFYMAFFMTFGREGPPKEAKSLGNGQGLGFQIGGLVIDNHTLRNAVIAIVGGLTTVVTTLLALSDDLERLTPFNNSQCELTSAQLDAMRTMAVAFANEKGSENCEYANITLADLLRP